MGNQQKGGRICKREGKRRLKRGEGKKGRRGEIGEGRNVREMIEGEAGEVRRN